MTSDIIGGYLISVALALSIINLAGFALLYRIYLVNKEKKITSKEVKRLERSFTALGLALPMSLSVIFISITSTAFNIDSATIIFLCYVLLTLSIFLIGYAFTPLLPVKIKIDLEGLKRFL